MGGSLYLINKTNHEVGNGLVKKLLSKCTCMCICNIEYRFIMHEITNIIILNIRKMSFDLFKDYYYMLLICKL